MITWHLCAMFEKDLSRALLHKPNPKIETGSVGFYILKWTFLPRVFIHAVTWGLYCSSFF